MSDASGIDVARSALLLMDLQTGIVDFAADTASLLSNAAAALKAARGAGMTVIHIGIGFRDGYPEVHANNRMFSGLKEGQVFQSQPHHPAVAPEGDEAVIVKHRVSCLHQTDLDMILRAQGIDTLFLSGCATSGVVLSTALAAADLDYRVNVLSDCCDDFAAETQSVLMNNVFPMQCTIMTGADFASAIAS